MKQLANMENFDMLGVLEQREKDPVPLPAQDPSAHKHSQAHASQRFCNLLEILELCSCCHVLCLQTKDSLDKFSSSVVTKLGKLRSLLRDVQKNYACTEDVTKLLDPLMPPRVSRDPCTSKTLSTLSVRVNSGPSACWTRISRPWRPSTMASPSLKPRLR